MSEFFKRNLDLNLHSFRYLIVYRCLKLGDIEAKVIFLGGL